MIITFKRYPFLWGLAGLIVAFVVGAVVASIGVHFFGSIQAFRSVLGKNGYWMLLWRVSVYGALAYIWTRFGRRKLIDQVATDRDGGTRGRLLLHKLERMICVVVVMIESYNLFTWWEV